MTIGKRITAIEQFIIQLKFEVLLKCFWFSFGFLFIRRVLLVVLTITITYNSAQLPSQKC